jgi:hypothetical protein
MDPVMEMALEQGTDLAMVLDEGPGSATGGMADSAATSTGPATT